MDPDFIRRRCRELSTELLQVEVFIQSGEYTPDALSIYREELAARVGDLDAFVAAERERTGEEQLRLEVSEFKQTGSSAPTRANAVLVPLRGALHFTSTGVGFLPAGVKPALQSVPLSLLGRLDQALFFAPRDEIGLFELRGRVWSLRARNNVTARARLAPDRVDHVAHWANDAGIRLNRCEAPAGLWEAVKGIFRS